VSKGKADVATIDAVGAPSAHGDWARATSSDGGRGKGSTSGAQDRVGAPDR
jgi:hypothetical protein